jgi:hypothetical protein
MTDKILLGTFTNKEKLNDFYERLEKSYSLKKENTFIFSINDSDNLMVTFKLNSGESIKKNIKSNLRGTIQIHKKGECFYTINALNKLIQKEFNLSEGNINYKTYTIDWDKYQNKLLLVKDDILHIQDIKKAIL